MQRVVVCIPARFGSQRLPGKPLRLLDGSPMISHVVRAARGASLASEVLVATDHDEIAHAARSAGARAVMTPSALPSGTDRVHDAIERSGVDADIVVNVQGDEPLLHPSAIDLAAQLLLQCPSAQMSTLSAPMAAAALLDPTKVKVVCRDAPSCCGGASGGADRARCRERPCRHALFFSRAPIGVDRSALEALVRPRGAAADPPPAAAAPAAAACRLHLGVYGFRRDALRRFVGLPPSPLEAIEKLEQMRALEAAMPIVVGELPFVPGGGVDTEEDLQSAQEALLARRRK